MPILQIRLLNSFQVVYDSVPLPATLPARMQALLAYLALQRAAPPSRRQLAFLFWPDASESQAHTNLRQLLHHLRRAWPAVREYLQIDAKVLQWQPGVAIELDVRVFEAAVERATAAAGGGQADAARAALLEAVALYTGDLLPDCYEDWLLQERERLRQSFLAALALLVVLCEDRRDYDMAIGYAQQMLRADPLHETTYQQLMRLYALHGDRASALRTYHLCASVLARELGVEPNPVTHEAYMRLLGSESPRAHDSPAAASSPAGERLVGRQRAWANLQAAWRSAVRGGIHFACISGETGLGKTRLAEAMLDWARDQGITLARTRAYATEGSLAYAPVTEWLRADSLQRARKRLADVLLSEVARILPELLVERPDLPHPAPMAEPWQRQRFFEAMARVVLAADQPLLLVIDDLQWCDLETLEWLAYLLRGEGAARVLILGTLRFEEVDERHPLAALLLQLRGTDRLTEIELGPLNAEETATLAAQTAARPLDPAAAARLYQETQGNPLFIVESIRSEIGRAEFVAGAGRAHDLGAPPFAPGMARAGVLPLKIQVVIQRRLAQLSPHARDLASLAAVVGRSFTFGLLSLAGGNDEDTLVAALDELWQRRIIRVQDTNTYDFQHDWIRMVAYAEISPIRRPLLHQRVARAMEQLHAGDLDAVCGWLALHCEQAGIADQAVTYYRRAATVAHHLLSYGEMEAYLKKCLALLDTLPATQGHLEQKLDILSLMGDVFLILKGFAAPEAEEVLTEAWQLCQAVGDNEKRFEVLRALRVHWGKRCRWDIATRLNQELLDLAQETHNSVYMQAALRFTGALAYHRGNLLEASDYFEQAISLYHASQRLSDTYDHEQDQGIATMRYCLNTLWLLGYPDRAYARMQEMLAMTRRLDRPFDMLISVDFALDLEHSLRRPEAVRALASEYTALTTRHPYPHCVAYELVFRGWALAQDGATGEGIALLQQGIAALRTMGVILFWPQVLKLLIAAYGLARRYAQGAALATETLAFLDETGESYFSAELQRLKGELLLAQGSNADEVEACFQQALSIARRQAAKSLELRAAVSTARLWRTQGRTAEAHALVAEVYGWFSEGFATVDLQEARSLLDELAPAK